MGISVCHYNSDQNMVTEKAFIPSTESYDFLEQGLDKLCYMNKNNQLFMLSGGNLYQVDLAECSYEILQESIQEDCFAASETGACAAWAEEMSLYDSKTVVEMDFDEQKSRTIKAEKGQRIRVLGFMNEDLIYGLASEGNLNPDQNGNRTFAMDSIRIEGFDGTVKKEYQESGEYLTNVDISPTLMTLEISRKSGNSYQPVRKDNVMNNKKVSAKKVEVELLTSSRQGIQIRLAFEEPINNKDPLVVYSKMEMGEENQIDLEPTRPRSEVYYVYARGSLMGSYLEPARAIQAADENSGVVLNRAQQYVWERGNKKTKIQLNLADVPDAFQRGILDQDELQENLGEKGQVMDLSGCSLDSVLYEVSAQRPIVARTGEDTSVVIVGYDQYNTYLYDPVTKEMKPYGINDSTELFAKEGNVFFSYVENIKE